MMNAWVRGAPRRSSIIIIHESKNFDKGSICQTTRSFYLGNVMNCKIHKMITKYPRRFMEGLHKKSTRGEFHLKIRAMSIRFFCPKTILTYKNI